MRKLLLLGAMDKP
jgi:hypothetical protein